METPLHSITVRTTAHEDVAADRADLMVTVRGASLITGAAALAKAREVRQLVSELTQFGVPQEDIHLQGVTAAVTSSLIGKSSSATYHLRIRVLRLDDLADVLGIVTAQKNTALTAIHWGYPPLDAEQDRLLERCLARAQAKAQLIARALASALVAVHSVTENLGDPESGHMQPFVRSPTPQAAAMRTRQVTQEELGLSVTHTKRVTVQVEVVYQIAPVRSVE